ncbi:multicopper oxidase domain-containing protein [Hymenobacter sp. RP-2-7]|uniref:Multicopper oxidase domain-containing protein n=1 Tax=Hymenobacter polaris TaxID=2682546 RepID=A0A7Y0AFW3_9BACT|nr:multicopper oxidase domain-containing protein [Hymenobacter polaris]NML66610.1 multicopper oxidase domain-containing protein [Hymenobacter polaris]
MPRRILLLLLLVLPTLVRGQRGPVYARPAAYAGLYSSPEAARTRTPRLVRYDLAVRDTVLVRGGARNHALATNGQVPAPTLTSTEGDTALIYVRNNTGRTISFHWHGMLLPNRYDGVPILTTEPIAPGTVHTYRFAIKQHGTLWYHSHTRLNEQLGQYGPIVVYPPTPLPTPDQVVLLSDWTRERP